jgi:hypothetical protein
MYVGHRFQLELKLLGGKADATAIVQAVLAQTLCMTLGSIIDWWQ